MTRPTRDTRRISREHILHYVLSFCTSSITSEADPEADHPRTWPGIDGFVSGTFGVKAQPGDLVKLSSAPVSKFILGWLREIDTTTTPGWPRYLIESIEDGDLCWWSNVGIDYLPRRRVAPSWQWTDRQWAFKKRWWNVCYKDRNAYAVRPLMPEFGDGFSVTLGTRTSHGFDDIRPTRTFPDWRKVTRAMMAACYDECVAEREAQRLATKSVAG